MAKVMLDQKSRMSRFDSHADVAEVMTKIFIIFAIFVMLVASYAIYSQLNTPMILADQPDFMVSPDFADYMHRQGSGMVFNEMDVQ